jgi:hypothetical protein
MSGDGWLADPQPSGQLHYRPFALAQLFDDRPSIRIAEGLEGRAGEVLGHHGPA